jgi:hypothetical protein
MSDAEWEAHFAEVARLRRVEAAATDLFASLDRCDPGWRKSTMVDGDEVNAAWCALRAALEGEKEG